MISICKKLQKLQRIPEKKIHHISIKLSYQGQASKRSIYRKHLLWNIKCFTGVLLGALIHTEPCSWPFCLMLAFIRSILLIDIVFNIMCWTDYSINTHWITRGMSSQGFSSTNTDVWKQEWPKLSSVYTFVSYFLEDGKSFLIAVVSG